MVSKELAQEQPGVLEGVAAGRILKVAGPLPAGQELLNLLRGKVGERHGIPPDQLLAEGLQIAAQGLKEGLRLVGEILHPPPDVGGQIDGAGPAVGECRIPFG